MVAFPLNTWLASQPREIDQLPFTVFDVTEKIGPDETMLDQLALLMESWVTHPKLIAALRSLLGDAERNMLDVALPSTPNLRAGAFGEALSATICEQWHSYLIPLRKLRFTGGSPGGTDLLALKLAEGAITEVCYVESKLRTFTDYGAALDAHSQLAKAAAERYPVILNYVANFLLETGSDLSNPFLTYLKSRAEQPALDSFRIALTWDASHWSEQVAQNLIDAEEHLSPLTMDVIKIGDLKSLIENVYRCLGVDVLHDDDRSE